MMDQRHLAPVQGAPAVVESCWLCGIRLPTDRLVADGGSGCSDIRWYCRDMRGCTERWTAHLPRPAAAHGAPPLPRSELLTAVRPAVTAPHMLARE